MVLKDLVLLHLGRVYKMYCKGEDREGYNIINGQGTDYVVSRYPPPPHTIHPSHEIATILGESVIVLQRLRIPSNKIRSQFTTSSSFGQGC